MLSWVILEVIKGSQIETSCWWLQIMCHFPCSWKILPGKSIGFDGSSPGGDYILGFTLLKVLLINQIALIVVIHCSETLVGYTIVLLLVVVYSLWSTITNNMIPPNSIITIMFDGTHKEVTLWAVSILHGRLSDDRLIPWQSLKI